MTTSAFKSTSRRPSTSSSKTSNKQQLQQSKKHHNSTQKAPPRRSRSVSAFSRTHLDTTLEFQNKTDNPLFWVDGSPNSDKDFDGVKLSNSEISKFVGVNNLKGSSDFGGESRRGRSVSRNSEGDTKFSGGGGEARKSVGRSLSRVDTARRRRSSSRGHYVNYESGSQIPCWDDGTPTSYFSEAEEKTIKPVSEEIKIIPLKDNNETTGRILETVRSEVRQAISDMQNDFKNAMRRSNSDVIHSSFISDATPEQENSSAVGLVQDFREEFERELEECEERAKKLRVELAVEEHRETELNQILNDIVPEPKTPVVQKPRAVRKASYERKKMSKNLEEEAMAYFDECVSISTFDDSDFSSLEDLHNMVGVDGPGSENVGLPGGPSVVYSFESQDDTQRKTIMQCNEASSSTVRKSRNSSVTKPPFSLTSKPSNTISLEDEIRNYIKSFSKDGGSERSYSHVVGASHQNTEDYNCEVPMEKLWLDRLTFRSRIESGRMLLCGGGLGFSFAPFSSLL